MPLKGRLCATKSRRMGFIEELKALGPGDDCVFWPWSAVSGRYVFVRYDGRTTTAHRWVYEQINGPVPDGLEACHTCDTPACVRPSHVYAGTHSQNIKDSYDRGHRARNLQKMPHAKPGEEHHGAKLTSEDVRKIRVLLGYGVSRRILGEAFGVSPANISRISRGITWRSVG